MTMKTVGIIGGLGPETTSEFYLDIAFSCQKKDKTVRPLIIISSIPLPWNIEEDSIGKKENMHKVGIVSTSATVENKLYENAFAKNNIEYVAPNELQQAKIGKIILNLVTGQHKNQDREELISIINDFEDKNLDCVILACTDLQLLIPQHQSIKIFDTMKIFADATVQEIFKD